MIQRFKKVLKGFVNIHCLTCLCCLMEPIQGRVISTYFKEYRGKNHCIFVPLKECHPFPKIYHFKHVLLFWMYIVRLLLVKDQNTLRIRIWWILLPTKKETSMHKKIGICVLVLIIKTTIKNRNPWKQHPNNGVV